MDEDTARKTMVAIQRALTQADFEFCKIGPDRLRRPKLLFLYRIFRCLPGPLCPVLAPGGPHSVHPLTTNNVWRRGCSMVSKQTGFCEGLFEDDAGRQAALAVSDAAKLGPNADKATIRGGATPCCLFRCSQS